MPETRIQIPGGALTIQDLRDLVGWAGSARARGFRIGDAQDLVLEAAQAEPGPPPQRTRQNPGSLQSSAFGDAPTASLPWLTTGVWMDLLAVLPDPGELDVQVLHDPVHGLFTRHGHIRLTARKSAHRWDLQLRRPGSDRLLSAGQFDTGDLASCITKARLAWEAHDEHFWHGDALETLVAPPAAQAGREGFHRETTTSFSFGFGPPAGRIAVDRLRDLTWLASETGASRAWLTPGRILLFEGLPTSRRKDWMDWLARSHVPETHGELERAVTAAGWSDASQAAAAEVLANLRQRDRMPPARRLLVASEALNRGDGVTSLPYPVLIRTAASWLYRSGDGRRSGEGSLDEVLNELEASRSAVAVPPITSAPVVSGHRCRACFTIYETRYGDPQGGVESGTMFESLPGGWVCPVCGGAKAGFLPIEAAKGPDATLVS